jgi:WD40 repeat protein
MINFENENILKTILNSLHLYDRQQVSKVMNKALFTVLLYRLDDYDYFKSIGKTQFLIDEHTKDIMSIVQITNGNVLTASEDGIIKFWDINNFLCIKTLTFENKVTSVITLRDDLVAVGLGSQIKIYNTKDFNCTDVISFNKLIDYDNLLLLSDGNLACTARKTIKTYISYILILNGHNKYNKINTLSVDGRGLSLINLSEGRFAYACEFDIKIFAKTSFSLLGVKLSYFDKFKKVKVLDNQDVYALAYSERYNIMISGSLDGTITAWDMGNYQKIKTINDSDKVLSLLMLPNGYFASGLMNGSIKLFSMTGYKCINILKSQTSQVTSLLLLKDKRIISGSNDGSIIIWN